MQSLSILAGGVSLRQLFPAAEFVGMGDMRVSSCSCDSRHCRPGDLFVALPGAAHHGRDFAVHAMARGAKAVLTDQLVRGLPLPACIVPNARAAYGALCQALVGNPAQRLKVVAVTGTNGKTTTSFLTAAVLEAGGLASGVIGTLGYFDGAEIGMTSLTTPDAAELARHMARMEANGCSHIVLEASSHALAQDRLAGVDLDVAAVTNICHDHLDYHGTPEDYRRAKERVFGLLKPEGLGVFNVDDRVTAAIVDRYPGPAITVGIDRAAEITATCSEQFISEQTFLLEIDDVMVPVRTSLIGRHNVYNCLVAAAIGSVYGVEPAAIAAGLESVTVIPGRLERIECGQDFGVFVDYAHTPDALAGILDTLRPLTRGRLICVFGAGGDRDRFKRPMMGRVVDAKADLAVVTSDNPRGEDPRQIANEILGGMRRRERVEVQLDRAHAIDWALAQAQPGDCVVIAGKGHEDYQLVDDEKLYFDDREAARQWLYANYRPARLLKKAA